jgi:RNA polymerase sigma-70 factor (ECF subfamily)
VRLPAAQQPGALPAAGRHRRGAQPEATDWQQVLALYDQLSVVAPGPVVALNGAVALAEVEGPAAALLGVEALDLPPYLPFHLTRAELLLRLGRRAEAVEAYDRALGLSTNEVERGHLRQRRLSAAPPAAAAPSAG